MKWDKLKPWLIPLALVAVVILFIIQFKRISEFFSSLFSASTPVDQTVLDESGALISDIRANSIAEALYNSMNQLGTDEAVIFESFKGLNDGDFAKVYNAFGLRPFIEFIGVGTDDNMLGVNMDLIGWLKHDLTSSEYISLRRAFPSFF